MDQIWSTTSYYRSNSALILWSAGSQRRITSDCLLRLQNEKGEAQQTGFYWTAPKGNGGCLGKRPEFLALHRGDTLWFRRHQTWEGHRRHQAPTSNFNAAVD
jgi:hypothetical protein